MKPLLSKMFRAAGMIESLLISKATLARRARRRTEARERNEMEAERLDRLSHPRNYQGR